MSEQSPDYPSLLRRLRFAVGEHYSNCSNPDCAVCEVWPDLHRISTGLDTEEAERRKRAQAEFDRQEEIRIAKETLGDD